MEWQQKVLRILDFHESKLKEHGAPVPSNVKNGWSLHDTAKHLNLSVATISHDLRLAHAFKKEPEKFKGVSKQKALSLLLQNSTPMVELKYAKSLMTGKLLKIVEHDGFDYYFIKLSKTIETPYLDLNYLILPAYYCKVFRE